jgi:hypothetical protein
MRNRALRNSVLSHQPVKEVQRVAVEALDETQD